MTRSCKSMLLVVALVSISCNSAPMEKRSKKRALGVEYLLQKNPDEPSQDSMESVSCLECHSAVGLFRPMIRPGRNSLLINAATLFCLGVTGNEKEVCQGYIAQYVNQLSKILPGNDITDREICSLVLGDRCGPAPRLEWKLKNHQKPEHIDNSSAMQNESDAANQIKFLHITDMHLDTDYLEGTATKCKYPLCCRSGQPQHPDQGAGPWGNYNCDTPLALLENAFKHISKNNKQALDFIVWTGDDTPHDTWNSTRADHLKVFKKIYGLLTKYFPNTTILPAIGNHEAAPVNSFPPVTPDVENKYDISWLYSEASKTWTTSWLPHTTSTTIQKGGYYSVLLYPGFRVISVNSNFCNTINLWLLKENGSVDPADELDWLRNQLQTAEQNDEKVYIIGHIPPGTGDCMKSWSHEFYKIVNRFSETIQGQFYGHTHYDHFEMFYNYTMAQSGHYTIEQMIPTGVALIGGSITPHGGNNPSYKIYTVDRENNNWSPSKVDTFYLDLDAANLNDNPEWKILYSLPDKHLKGLKPTDWNDYLNIMIDDPYVFDIYRMRYHRDSSVRFKCDYTCETRMLCDCRSGKSNAPELCADIDRAALSIQPISSQTYYDPRNTQENSV